MGNDTDSDSAVITKPQERFFRKSTRPRTHSDSSTTSNTSTASTKRARELNFTSEKLPKAKKLQIKMPNDLEQSKDQFSLIMEELKAIKESQLKTEQAITDFKKDIAANREDINKLLEQQLNMN